MSARLYQTGDTRENPPKTPILTLIDTNLPGLRLELGTTGVLIRIVLVYWDNSQSSSFSLFRNPSQGGFPVIEHNIISVNDQ